ncbi:MAG: hypothetical protein P1U64_11830 [Alcanivoracaceae bacterium]|nr:hypothetical protein [Alcanivoracaceae bacterium]
MEDLAGRSGLSWGSASAKVSNFKSLAGKNGASNASKNSIRIFEAYGHFDADEIRRHLDRMKEKNTD